MPMTLNIDLRRAEIFSLLFIYDTVRIIKVFYDLWSRAFPKVLIENDTN